MSTYADTPYIYAQLSDTMGSTCAEQTSYALKLANLFSEAGWTVTEVPFRVKITTEAAGGFHISTLGAGNYPFYTVTVGSGDSFVPDDTMDDLCATWVADCECVSNPLLNHRGQGFGTPDAADGASRHQYILYAIKYCYDQNGVDSYHTETTYDSDLAQYSTYLYINNYSCSLDLPTIGNQLQGFVTIDYGGYIVKSQDSILPGNNISFFIEYTPSPTDPDFVFYYAHDGFGDFSVAADTNPIETQYFCPSYQLTHYAAIVSGTYPKDTIASLTSEDYISIGMSTVKRYDYFVNPYTFIMNTKADDLSGAAGCIFAAALKLKALEGEVLETDAGYPDDLNIQQAVIVFTVGGDGLKATNSPAVSEYALKFAGNGFSTVKTTGGDVNTSIWGPLTLNSLANSSNFTLFNTGVSWMSGAAEIAEPWVACSFLRAEDNFPALVVGQLWGACVPYRRLSLGTTIPAPYFWDGQIWRYYQTNKGTTNTGPPSSLSFRVQDLGIYNGSSYTGEERVTILTLDATPTSIPNGYSVQIDVTFTAPGSRGGFIVLHTPNDERCQFSSHIQTFGEGVTSLSVTVSTIDLQVEETATIKAISENTLTKEITFLEN